MTMTSSQDICVFSFSHHNTTVAERDRLSLSSDEIIASIPLLRERANAEAGILSTCNRTEFYLFGSPSHDQLWEQLRAVICEVRSLSPVKIPSPLQKTSREAARHLFRVASSLESVALGENQILAQVKGAHELLLKAPGKSPVLDRLFQFAVRAGKLVRTQTSLCDGAVSISSASVQLAKQIFGQLNGQHVLLVGAGETSLGAGVHFQAAGVQRFTIANRGAERGQELARRFGGQYIGLDAMLDALVHVDIAVFATGASAPLLSGAHMKQLMKRRGYRPIFLIDISNPRNVEASVADYDGAFLYNIDDLKQIVDQNMHSRAHEVPRAEAILEELLAEWDAWLQSMRVVPTISALSRRFDELRRAELDAYGAQLSDQERELLERFSKHLTKKLLHHPIQHLREQAQEATLRAEDLDLIWALHHLHDHE
jgi:glutamyl-tRNA reductase